MVTPNFIDLYRAVSVAELADIAAIGQYRILPGGVEGKYFALSLSDARYFRDQVILDAEAIVQSSVSPGTFNRLEQGIFDQRPGAFANPGTLPTVSSDSLRFGGIRRLE
jgi:hypothetical protein